jgi:hypothetical protein
MGIMQMNNGKYWQQAVILPKEHDEMAIANYNSN